MAYDHDQDGIVPNVEITVEYKMLINKIVPFETAAQLLMIATLVLMVVKPF